MAASKLTNEQFKRVQVAGRMALLKGAKFADDTPAKRVRRMAEAVVLPSRFNAHYLPHYFRTAPAGFHLALYMALEAHQRIVVRAPRGHAKSTVLTFAYVLHQVVCARVLRAWRDGTLEASDPKLYAAIREVMHEELVRRLEAAQDAHAHTPDLASSLAVSAAAEALAKGELPLHWDPYIQVISVTLDTAAEFAGALKVELLENELLRSDWGELFSEARQSDGDWVSDTDVRVRAFGMMSAIRGGKHGAFRPTLAVLDDPDSEETIGTTRLRDRQTRKITAGINFGLEPKIGRMIMVGTPIHADCQVCRFTAPGKFGRWHKLRFAAITSEGVPLWPERWTLEALRQEEEDDPEAFQMEMMDVPPSTGKPFDELHYYDREQFADADLPVVLAVDPALGKTEDSDFQAVIVLRGPTPEEGWILVHRVLLLRIGDPTALARKLGEVYDDEQPDMAVMETIGFQSLLLTLVNSDSQRSQLVRSFVEIPSQNIAKDLRIRGIAPLVNRGVVRFPSDRTCRPLELQAQDYPDGKRDGLDVLEMGLRQVRRSKRRAAADIRHGSRSRPVAFARAQGEDWTNGPGGPVKLSRSDRRAARSDGQGTATRASRRYGRGTW